MLDIRHKNVSPRECAWIAAAYGVVCLALIALGVWWVYPTVLRGRLDPTGGVKINPWDDAWTEHPYVAEVMSPFPGCPVRETLISASWKSAALWDKADQSAVTSYLTDHGCIILKPKTLVLVRDANRGLRCVRPLGATALGCYWTPVSILEGTKDQ